MEFAFGRSVFHLMVWTYSIARGVDLEGVYEALGESSKG